MRGSREASDKVASGSILGKQERESHCSLEEEQVQGLQWECLRTSKVVGEAAVEGMDKHRR